MIAKSDYISLWQQKKNDTSSNDKLDPIIIGHDIYDVLDKSFVCFMR